MRKNNKMALRVLSTATFLAMVASCTAPAFAGTYYLEKGDITVNAKEDGNHITQGDLYQDHLDEGKTIITDHEDKNDTSAVSNTVTIKVDEGVTGDVTIKDANIDNSSASEYTAKSGITVDTKGESSKANITLDNVTIKPGEDGDGGNNDGGAGLEVKGNGTANIELNGDNTLNGGIYHAGVEKDDTKGTGNLIIKDDYNDNGTEKSEEEKKDSPTGSLTANGGFDAAGIGSSDYDHTSNIEISGGKVVASGGYDAAGIGGSKRGAAENIKISGGDITASAGSGAGIGSGFDDDSHLYGGHANSIEITGGTIHATSNTGAGIGGSEQSDYVDITISGGNITAESRLGAGIGTGDNAEESATIRISGKDTVINATSKSGAGIGSGYCDDSDSQYTITINDGTVNATGSTGIGIADDGTSSTSANITINSGKITATATSHSAGIGNGWDSSSEEEAVTNITITGGDITAVGGKGAAGIGDGAHNYDNTVNVIITGGTIKAVGGEGAAAIGGGMADDVPSKTTVKIDSSNRALKITAIVQGDSKGAIGNGTVDSDDPFSGVDFDDITVDSLGEEHGALVQFMNNYNAETGTGTLYKAIHNKKYIEETYNNPDDDHEWGNPKIIKEAAPGVPGIIRYTCVVDGCGATHDVPYDYKAPEEPGNTPTTPDVKPDTPAAPDAPVQDVTPGTADTTPADGTVLPGNVQNPDVLDAKPEDAPVTPANAVNPAVQNAKALPQTGSNWLAVLGTALSGAFLMAAGFFLDRKRGENR